MAVRRPEGDQRRVQHGRIYICARERSTGKGERKSKLTVSSRKSRSQLMESNVATVTRESSIVCQSVDRRARTTRNTLIDTLNSPISLETDSFPVGPLPQPYRPVEERKEESK